MWSILVSLFVFLIVLFVLLLLVFPLAPKNNIIFDYLLFSNFIDLKVHFVELSNQIRPFFSNFFLFLFWCLLLFFGWFVSSFHSIWSWFFLSLFVLFDCLLFFFFLFYFSWTGDEGTQSRFICSWGLHRWSICWQSITSCKHEL